MDLSEYRASPTEQARIANLMDLVPSHGCRALDIGTRDGHLAKLLAERYDHVVALDLEKPALDVPGVLSVAGNVTCLQFADAHFDLVVCAEVLEHIPTALLRDAGREISRVASKAIIVGVPYRQDTRLGRTTCAKCGLCNPPWGHVNSFDEEKLAGLFPRTRVDAIKFVGSTKGRTNWLSASLMNFAGNPYGTYGQGEVCVHCGQHIGTARPRTFLQKVATRAATEITRTQSTFTRPLPNWIHMRLSRLKRVE
jgi:SAM-dependent methyltransferase